MDKVKPPNSEHLEKKKNFEIKNLIEKETFFYNFFFNYYPYYIFYLNMVFIYFKKLYNYEKNIKKVNHI